MSQLNTIRNILLERGEISNFQAIDQKLTLRLAAHIHKLRGKLQPGWVILTESRGTDTIYKLQRNQHESL